MAGLHRKLQLVREEKLYRLIPGLKKRARLEASGVALLGDARAGTSRFTYFGARLALTHWPGALR